ncbi:unnamed protein product [Bursaphelenchus okinawaensis]|uniref:ARID domain-containing protein n=1 Tax=Bursaphelenchus okinawaensis TaxID=465554 RepID=A0A811KNH5_9BILA|nr:unnamed protein product [Bursaphelenchus okinawaensis]CAG9107277.1 unnamed protein product [Bursaphelenchus okinawaensis]
MGKTPQTPSTSAQASPVPMDRPVKIADKKGRNLGPSDFPHLLDLGTDVSAKFKGAFCEARVMEIETETVEIRVILKDQPFVEYMVTPRLVRGKIAVNEPVVVYFDGKLMEAQIQHVKDLSRYRVVFNDGDEKSLRRSQMVLKGAKHFDSQINLDNLPLDNPDRNSSADNMDLFLGTSRSITRQLKAIYQGVDPDMADSPKSSIRQQTQSDRSTSDASETDNDTNTSSTLSRPKKKKLKRQRSIQQLSVPRKRVKKGRDSSDDSDLSDSDSTTRTPKKKTRNLGLSSKHESEDSSTPAREIKKEKKKHKPSSSTEFAEGVLIMGRLKFEKKTAAFFGIVISPSAYIEAEEDPRPPEPNEYPVRILPDGKVKLFRQSQLEVFDADRIPLEELGAKLKRSYELAMKYAKMGQLPEDWSEEWIFGPMSKSRKAVRKRKLSDQSIGSFKESQKSTKDSKEKDTPPLKTPKDTDKAGQKEMAEKKKEQREQFYTKLEKFFEKNDKTLTTAPILASGDTLDLFQLFRLVRKKGGVKEMNKAAWTGFTEVMGIKGVISGEQLREQYIKYLEGFETTLKYKKDPVWTGEKEKKQRTSSVSSTSRSTISTSPSKKLSSTKSQTPSVDKSGKKLQKPEKLDKKTSHSGTRIPPPTDLDEEDGHVPADIFSQLVETRHVRAAHYSRFYSARVVDARRVPTDVILRVLTKIVAQIKEGEGDGDKGQNVKDDKTKSGQGVKDEKLKAGQGSKDQKSGQEAKHGAVLKKEDSKDFEASTSTKDSHGSQEGSSDDKKNGRDKLSMLKEPKATVKDQKSTLSSPQKQDPESDSPSKLEALEGQKTNLKITDPLHVEALEELGRITMVFVHYNGWNVRYDEWVTLDRLKVTPETRKQSMLALRTNYDFPLDVLEAVHEFYANRRLTENAYNARYLESSDEEDVNMHAKNKKKITPQAINHEALRPELRAFLYEDEGYGIPDVKPEKVEKDAFDDIPNHELAAANMIISESEAHRGKNKSTKKSKDSPKSTDKTKEAVRAVEKAKESQKVVDKSKELMKTTDKSKDLAKSADKTTEKEKKQSKEEAEKERKQKEDKTEARERRNTLKERPEAKDSKGKDEKEAGKRDDKEGGRRDDKTESRKEASGPEARERRNTHEKHDRLQKQESGEKEKTSRHRAESSHEKGAYDDKKGHNDDKKGQDEDKKGHNEEKKAQNEEKKSHNEEKKAHDEKKNEKRLQKQQSTEKFEERSSQKAKDDKKLDKKQAQKTEKKGKDEKDEDKDQKQLKGKEEREKARDDKEKAKDDKEKSKDEKEKNKDDKEKQKDDKERRKEEKARTSYSLAKEKTPRSISPTKSRYSPAKDRSQKAVSEREKASDKEKATDRERTSASESGKASDKERASITDKEKSPSKDKKHKEKMEKKERRQEKEHEKKKRHEERRKDDDKGRKDDDKGRKGDDKARKDDEKERRRAEKRKLSEEKREKEHRERRETETSDESDRKREKKDSESRSGHDKSRNASEKGQNVPENAKNQAETAKNQPKSTSERSKIQSQESSESMSSESTRFRSSRPSHKDESAIIELSQYNADSGSSEEKDPLSALNDTINSVAHQIGLDSGSASGSKAGFEGSGSRIQYDAPSGARSQYDGASGLRGQYDGASGSRNQFEATSGPSASTLKFDGTSHKLGYDSTSSTKAGYESTKTSPESSFRSQAPSEIPPPQFSPTPQSESSFNYLDTTATSEQDSQIEDPMDSSTFSMTSQSSTMRGGSATSESFVRSDAKGFRGDSAIARSDSEAMKQDSKLRSQKTPMMVRTDSLSRMSLTWQTGTERPISVRSQGYSESAQKNVPSTSSFNVEATEPTMKMALKDNEKGLKATETGLRSTEKGQKVMAEELRSTSQGFKTLLEASKLQSDALKESEAQKLASESEKSASEALNLSSSTFKHPESEAKLQEAEARRQAKARELFEATKRDLMVPLHLDMNIKSPTPPLPSHMSRDSTVTTGSTFFGLNSNQDDILGPEVMRQFEIEQNHLPVDPIQTPKNSRKKDEDSQITGRDVQQMLVNLGLIAPNAQRTSILSTNVDTGRGLKLTANGLNLAGNSNLNLAGNLNLTGLPIGAQNLRSEYESPSQSQNLRSEYESTGRYPKNSFKAVTSTSLGQGAKSGSLKQDSSFSSYQTSQNARTSESDGYRMRGTEAGQNLEAYTVQNPEFQATRSSETIANITQQLEEVKKQELQIQTELLRHQLVANQLQLQFASGTTPQNTAGLLHPEFVQVYQQALVLAQTRRKDLEQQLEFQKLAQPSANGISSLLQQTHLTIAHLAAQRRQQLEMAQLASQLPTRQQQLFAGLGLAGLGQGMGGIQGMTSQSQGTANSGALMEQMNKFLSSGQDMGALNGQNVPISGQNVALPGQNGQNMTSFATQNVVMPSAHNSTSIFGQSSTAFPPQTSQNANRTADKNSRSGQQSLSNLFNSATSQSNLTNSATSQSNLSTLASLATLAHQTSNRSTPTNVNSNLSTPAQNSTQLLPLLNNLRMANADQVRMSLVLIEQQYGHDIAQAVQAEFEGRLLNQLLTSLQTTPAPTPPHPPATQIGGQSAWNFSGTSNAQTVMQMDTLNTSLTPSTDRTATPRDPGDAPPNSSSTFPHFTVQFTTQSQAQPSNVRAELALERVTETARTMVTLEDQQRQVYDIPVQAQPCEDCGSAAPVFSRTPINTLPPQLRSDILDYVAKKEHLGKERRARPQQDVSGMSRVAQKHAVEKRKQEDLVKEIREGQANHDLPIDPAFRDVKRVFEVPTMSDVMNSIGLDVFNTQRSPETAQKPSESDSKLKSKEQTDAEVQKLLELNNLMKPDPKKDHGNSAYDEERRKNDRELEILKNKVMGMADLVEKEKIKAGLASFSIETTPEIDGLIHQTQQELAKQREVYHQTELTRQKLANEIGREQNKVGGSKGRKLY